MPITSAEYRRLVAAAAERDTLQAQRDREARAAEEARLREVARAEGAEAALTQQRESWSRDLEAERQRGRDVETRWHRAERDRAIAAGVAGAPFASDSAAQQFQAIAANRFETRTDASGTVVVQEVGTGRPAAEVLREMRESPDYAHFFQPARGGGGAPVPRPNGANPQGEGRSIADLNRRGYEMAQAARFSRSPFDNFVN